MTEYKNENYEKIIVPKYAYVLLNEREDQEKLVQSAVDTITRDEIEDWISKDNGKQIVKCLR